MSRPKEHIRLLAESQPELSFEGDSLPTFRMLAYTGGSLGVSRFKHPVVVDLSKLNLGRAKKPILLDHITSRIVGHSETTTNTGQEILVEGIISGSTASATEVVESAKKGFPWQASIGVDVFRVRELKAGSTEVLNGKAVDGPVIIVEDGTLVEISFVALGADSNSEVSVAAELELTTETGEEEVPTDETTQEERNQEMEELQASTDLAIQAIRAEQVRVTEITKVCASKPEIVQNAVAQGLSVAEAKAAMFDAAQVRTETKVEAAYVHVTKDETNEQVLEAAMVMQAGLQLTGYTDQTLSAAHKMRGLSLREMMRLCAGREGKQLSASAGLPDLVAAAYSTVSLPTILGNVAAKSLREGFEMTPSTAAILAEKLTTSTFHTHTGATLGGTGLMTDANSGELKHGTMAEETFTYKTNTVGKIIGLTRQDIINDDLGALTRLARNLGMSAYKTRELDFWTLVLANTGNYFHDNNDNLITDVLDIDALAVAEAKLLMQTGIDGTPADVRAQYLVVPPQLGAAARSIFASAGLIGDTDGPDGNIFAGVYAPVVTPYLGSEATEWYLWSSTTAPFGISYLNGNESPVVEEAPLTAEYLGRAWRAYYDYGVCQIDYRGAVKSTGAGS